MGEEQEKSIQAKIHTCIAETPPPLSPFLMVPPKHLFGCLNRCIQFRKVLDHYITTFLNRVREVFKIHYNDEGLGNLRLLFRTGSLCKISIPVFGSHCYWRVGTWMLSQGQRVCTRCHYLEYPISSVPPLTSHRKNVLDSPPSDVLC